MYVEVVLEDGMGRQPGEARREAVEAGASKARNIAGVTMEIVGDGRRDGRRCSPQQVRGHPFRVARRLSRVRVGQRQQRHRSTGD